MKLLIINVCLLFFFSCSVDKTEEEGEKIEIDLKGENIKSLYEILSFERFVYLETHPDALINSIDRLCVSAKGELIIFDRSSQKITLFSADGKYIRTIGKKGNGPQELNSAFDITFDSSKNFIYVLTQNKKIKVYPLRRLC
ncbi:6-bladed beta-propeller [Maribellus maritimus]|uniref:6-bladed beta-propeller n=1 Tax=Maribellus maritimus TaxID=2870838 RepID=UPI0021D44B00|nr:6-bladed beta-propeller [Maribellus maritimus]MCG6189589.1 6-bladed beta-propeller [Maribellus maritimus]